MKLYVPKFKAQVEISAKYIYSRTLLDRAWIWFLAGISCVKKILRRTLSVATRYLSITLNILKWMCSASMPVRSLMTGLLASWFLRSTRSISRHFDFRLVNYHLAWEQGDLLNAALHSTELKRVRKGEVPCQYFATIFGGVDAFLHSNSILTLSRHPHSQLILPDVFNKSLFLSSDRKVGKLVISPTRKIEKRKNVVSLVGTGTKNYCHFLLDHLPKIIIAQRVGTYKTIVVDEQMPHQHYEAVYLLKTAEQGVEILGLREPLESNATFIWPSCSTTLTHPSVNHVIGEQDSCFDKDLYRTMSKLLLEKVACVSGPPSPSRLFFDRSDGAARRIINKSNLQELLGRFGFVRVLPEKLSFAEQVKITNNADVVISQNGAATANLMFCKKGATFVGLTTNNPAVNSSYFPNLAKALGVRFDQLAFKATFSSLIHPAHLDFEVDLDEITSLLTKDLGLSPLKIGE